MFVTIKRSRPLPNHYVWFCFQCADSAFKHNVFTTADLQPDIDESVYFPNGSAWVHLRRPELRRAVGGKIYADFLISQDCEEGRNLYQIFRAKNEPYKRFERPKPSYTAMVRHVETCPLCRGMVAVNYEPIEVNEGNNESEFAVLGLAGCW